VTTGMGDLKAWKGRLADIIIERSFRYREDPPFRLASGRLSNYYFNCKPTTLDPEGMTLIGRILFAMTRDMDITAAGGLTLGADPLAFALSMVSFEMGRPIKAFVVRREVKDHGTARAVEGNVAAGERVVVLDDVITTGGSTITAIERAGEAGLVVAGVIALIDREEGGRENIEKVAGPVRSILTRTEIMARLKGEKNLA